MHEDQLSLLARAIQDSKERSTQFAKDRVIALVNDDKDQYSPTNINEFPALVLNEINETLNSWRDELDSLDDLHNEIAMMNVEALELERMVEPPPRPAPQPEGVSFHEG